MNGENGGKDNRKRMRNFNLSHCLSLLILFFVLSLLLVKFLSNIIIHSILNFFLYFCISYYEWLRQQFLRKRDILEEGLRAVGIEPVVSHGGFFMMGKLPYYKDLTVLTDLEMLSTTQEDNESNGFEPYDWQFCRKLASDYGVVAIPASPFFSPNSAVAESFGPLARFAFCKTDETLRKATNRLKAYAVKNNIVGLKKKEISP